MIGSVRSYTIGFILSVLITILAYIPVVIHQNSNHASLPHEIVIPLVICLAVLQLFIQLIFFLHLGHESGPRWKLGILVSTVSIILMVILGSLWIMYHLNYNMMHSKSVEEFIIHDESVEMDMHAK